MRRLLLVVTTALVTTTANAGGYGYGYNGYVYPYYNYNHYNYNTVDNVIVVGIPVQGLGLDYYYSVGDELREKRIADSVIRRLQVTQPRPQKQAEPTPAQLSLADFLTLGQKTRVGGLDEKVAEIFERSCLSCHKPGLKKDGFLLIDEGGGFVGTREFRRAVYEAVKSNAMPKGKPLDSRSKNTIREWAEEAR